MIAAILLDIDGTLIDNNLLHVLAWQRAFRRIGVTIDANRLVHLVGMGGDNLAPTVLGHGHDAVKQVSSFHTEEYNQRGLIDHAEPLPGASALLQALHERGIRTALASSAKHHEADRYLAMLGGRQVVDQLATAEDVTTTKPAPDIFAVALDRLGHPQHALAIGDTIYDIQAAQKLNLPCIAVLSGGIERDTLQQAGPRAIYADAADLLAHLDEVLNEVVERNAELLHAVNGASSLSLSSVSLERDNHSLE